MDLRIEIAEILKYCIKKRNELNNSGYRVDKRVAEPYQDIRHKMLDILLRAQKEGMNEAKAALHICSVSNRRVLLTGLLEMLEKEGGNEFIDKAEIVAKYEASL